MASSLFLKTSQALYSSGPASLLLAYLLMGSVSIAMLVPTRLNLQLMVDFTWGNGLLITSAWGVYYA